EKTDRVLKLRTFVTILTLPDIKLRLSCTHKTPSSTPREAAGLQGRTARFHKLNLKESEMEQIPFNSSAPNTLGIELELQLINPRSFDLAAAADELLAQMANHPIADRVKPEITRSMIELNSSVHEHPMGLLAEMREMRDALCEAADAVGVAVAGSGAHPLMRSQERARSDSPRFHCLAEMYGYLAHLVAVCSQLNQP